MSGPDARHSGPLEGDDARRFVEYVDQHPIRRAPLTRTPMARGRGAKTKGGSAEREVVAMAQQVGFPDARRNFMSGGQGGGDITGIPDVHIEVKRRESVRIWEWMCQALADSRQTDMTVVAFRRSRSPWYAVVELEELLMMLKELQELRSQ